MFPLKLDWNRLLVCRKSLLSLLSLSSPLLAPLLVQKRLVENNAALPVVYTVLETKGEEDLFRGTQIDAIDSSSI